MKYFSFKSTVIHNMSMSDKNNQLLYVQFCFLSLNVAGTMHNTWYIAEYQVRGIYIYAQNSFLICHINLQRVVVMFYMYFVSSFFLLSHMTTKCIMFSTGGWILHILYEQLLHVFLFLVICVTKCIIADSSKILPGEHFSDFAEHIILPV